MKLKSFLMAIVVLSAVVISCKKTDPTSEDNGIETTFEMSNNQAIADYLMEDAEDIMMKAAEENNLTGNKGGNPLLGNLVCATVTVTPQSGFPKTITIDFGPLPGCVDSFGIVRSGIIQVVISDSLRLPLSTATMTFNNYFVNGHKKEGTITWTNTSVPPMRRWRREVVNGKVTAPSGNWWLHNGVKVVTQNLVGMIITGHGNTINAAGVSRSHEIVEPLRKRFLCQWIDQGRIRFDGPNHFAILDYGNGACNNQATVSIDGQPPHAILLP
jgi:hypothetical protein